MDRDLGRGRVLQAVRDLGFIVHALYEVYGIAAEQSTKDPEWIKDSAANGWVCLCRDKLRHADERRLVQEHRARVFRVAPSAINATQQIEFIENNIAKIARLSQRPGPYIYRIERTDVIKVFPPRA